MMFKEFCKITEVPIDKQYFTNFDRVVNTDNYAGEAKYEGYEDQELS